MFSTADFIVCYTRGNPSLTGGKRWRFPKP